MNRIVLLILFASILMGCEQKKETKEIIFVCTYGATRSPLAAVYFNKLVKEQNLDYHAVFRGLTLEKTLTPETINGLIKDGFDVSTLKTKKISKEELKTALKVVEFDCSLPYNYSKSKNIEWNGTPSAVDDYDKARDVIKRKVRLLIENLKKE